MEFPLIKVLCVEDDDDDFDTLVRLLQSPAGRSEHDYKIERAKSAELAHAYSTVGDYDLFLVDFRLQGNETGVDFLRALRPLHPATPAILLSGQPELDIDPDTLSAIGTGRLVFLQKRNLDVETLRLQIKGILRRPMRLLVVDDDPEDYDLARAVLHMSEAYRFEVDWADSVDAARDQLLRNVYDGFLVDYHLNHESGIDFVQACIGEKAQAEKPVVLLTGHNDLDDDRDATRMLKQENVCLVSKHQMDTEHLVGALEQTGHWKPA